jgi:thymidine phosphorylase
MGMYAANELILKKRDGMALSREEIAAFVTGICDHSVTDAQLAAFAMATWFRGMEPDEQMALTLAMRDSGTVLDWSDLDGPVLDKHSTGGVGDMVSLLLAPVVAACGGYVPMISGRGLGHTGGTLDKLESIPGFVTAPGIARFQSLVKANGLAIVGQSSELVPADRRLYAVRDETATVSSVPLIVSSILSKKLAEGLDALVMDIKFGSGAFMQDPAEARRLARHICRVSHAAGVPCNALITDMGQPLAWSAGNALEVREAIGFLRGDARHPRLHGVLLALSAELLWLGGLAENRDRGQAMAGEALDSGRAAERFAAMVCGQGGPAHLLDDADHLLPSARVVAPVFSQSGGYVSRIDTRAIGLAVVQLGGGRQRAGDSIDHAVGFSGLAPVGQAVGPDAPFAVIHAENQGAWERAADAVRSAMTVGRERPAIDPVVHTRVTGDALDA